MLRKAQDIVGLPVIEVQAGKQVGTAKDIVINREWNILGVMLDQEHWFASPKYAGWEDIVSIGPDAVTVKDEHAARECDLREMNAFCLFDGTSKLRGLPVITVDGKLLGSVEDVYFGKKMDKQIVGYELSGGLISDFQEGRKWLSVSDQVKLGEDAVIVPGDSHTLEAPLFEEK